MGACESPIERKKSKHNSSHKSLEEKSTRPFSRMNSKKSYNSFKQIDGYILPSNLSKKEDINAYSINKFLSLIL